MSKDEDLKELEKRLWRSTFQDGLWDIYFGMLFFGIGIYTIGQLFSQDSTLLAVLILMIWDFSSFFMFFIAKRLIILPRMGFVRFKTERKVRKIKLTIFLVIMVVINVIFLFLPLSGFNLRLNSFTVMLMIGTFFIIIPVSVLAYYLEFERLYIIAIMGGLGLSISELLRPFVGSPVNSMITYCIIGGIIITWGLVYFLRFLKEYPLPKDNQKEEVNDG